MLVRLTLLLALNAALQAHAQMPLDREAVAGINQIFEHHEKHNTLRCSVVHFDPFLDFTFRYEAGFLVNLTPQQFSPGSRLGVYLRVTPQNGKVVFLGERFDVPTIPAQMAKSLGPRQLNKIQIQMSAGFAMGDGSYAIDLLLIDNQDHSCLSHWNLKTPKHIQPLALQPNTVAPVEANSWDGKLDSNGVRLTVLLHVAPINLYASKLYAWDRGFLLQSLSSLLKQLPCQSVRLIAFNLDQQEELFRQDQFDGNGYANLALSLRKLEFATISYQALKRGSWQHWLAGLTQEQTSAKDPSDVVVFLGPNSHFLGKLPGESRDHPDAAPRIFYLEYYPWLGADFPDSIDSLTHNMHGTVYKIHSSDEFGQAIQKILEKVKPQSSAASPFPEAVTRN